MTAGILAPSAPQPEEQASRRGELASRSMSSQAVPRQTDEGQAERGGVAGAQMTGHKLPQPHSPLSLAVGDPPAQLRRPLIWSWSHVQVLETLKVLLRVAQPLFASTLSCAETLSPRMDPAHPAALRCSKQAS